MSYQPTPIVLSDEEMSTLQSWVRSGKTEKRMAFRAEVILHAANGIGTNEIAEYLQVRPATVSKWRTRFAKNRLNGLRDAERSGKPPTYTASDEMRVLQALDQTPPPGFARWNGTLLGKHLGLKSDYVWSVLRKHGIQLERRRSWCISTDPQFAEKAADVVGLYLNPPENAVVISVDEKPSIQALERAQGYLRLPNGKTLSGFSHDYKRHGTTTLFAALEIATGMVQAGHYKRRRRVEFLDFMNRVVAAHPGKEIHVILDNLNTHKPKRDRWLSLHKNVHFHFTPTHASWLNQVEVWFSILTRNTLQGSSFTSPQQVRRAIDDFVKVYNESAHPFEWTKEVVHPTAPRKRYADLNK